MLYFTGLCQHCTVWAGGTSNHSIDIIWVTDIYVTQQSQNLEHFLFPKNDIRMCFAFRFWMLRLKLSHTRGGDGVG